MQKSTKYILIAGGVALLAWLLWKKTARAASAKEAAPVTGSGDGSMTPHPTKSDGTPEDPLLESWMLYNYAQATKPSDSLWSDPFSQPTETPQSQEDFLESRL